MIEAFIRSLMVGGQRSISLTRMLIQGQVSSTPKCNDSKFKPKQIKFLRRENDLRVNDAKKLTHVNCKTMQKLTSCQKS